MSEQQQPNQIANTTSFCFKYCINLGDGKFGTMKINQKTNLYQQAQNFCKLYSLQPYIAVILENQIFQQILKIKQQQLIKDNKNIKNNSNHKNKKNKSQEKIYIIEKNNKSKPTLDKYKQNNISEENFCSSSKVTVNNNNDKGTQKKQCISKHFQNMFKKYQEIQNKKQMERKASYSKIPFKPVINNLSRKIVDLKRSALTKNDQNQCHVFKPNTKSGSTTIIAQKQKQKQSKQGELESKNSAKLLRKSSKSRFR